MSPDAASDIAALVAALVAVLGVGGWLLWLFWQGPPYIPSKDVTIDEMVKLSQIKQGMRLAELGSGDGRLAIALAQAGAEVDGYEINPFLVLFARRNARRAGVADRVHFHRRNFWKVDFSKYHGVTIFGIPHIMERVGKKLARELPAGSRVVSNAFPIPGLPKSTKTQRAFSYIIVPKA